MWNLADGLQFVPAGGAAAAFFLAGGIKWNKIENAKKKEEKSSDTEL